VGDAGGLRCGVAEETTMAEDEPENVVLRYLRDIREDLKQVKSKLLDHDHQFAFMRGQLATIQGEMAREFGQRIELEQRVERIERRLELRDEDGSTA
jgi:septal ring factor EnvC (AmiA/AmiB activator)